MKPEGIRWIGSLAAAAASAALASSCTSPMLAPVDATPPAARSANVTTAQIAHIEFGRQASQHPALHGTQAAVIGNDGRHDLHEFDEPHQVGWAKQLRDSGALGCQSNKVEPIVQTGTLVACPHQ